jgi:hypothetical protein
MIMKRGAKWATTVGLLLIMSTGCSGDINLNDSPIAPLPRCTPTSQRDLGSIVLVAQSVPTAQLVPCVRAVPAGWRFDHMDARNGRTRLYFNASQAGDVVHPLTLTLKRDCEVGSASRRTSDEPGTTAYEHIKQTESTYVGKRFYKFPGGCVTYDFNVHGGTFVGLLDAMTGYLDFISRDDLAAKVDELSDGQLQLDTKDSAT